jgi:hypothetical protein
VLVPVLVISGTVGVGKTTVSYETRLQLRDAGVSHVLIDDEFGLFHPRLPDDPDGTRLSTLALAALWAVYRNAGFDRLVLASIVEAPADLVRIATAVPGAEIQVFQLVAPFATVAERIRGRVVPSALDWCLERAAQLIEQFERHPLDHVEEIDASERPPRALAAEIISRSGWTAAAP